MANKEEELDKLKQEILDKNICPELAESATQLVMGEGDVDAEIVFIGEAPGKQEDLQGKPFVGASGKFLNEMLATINLTRNDVYVTNIVKYRPPNNRDPSPQEKHDFRAYLDEQLDIIQPQLLVTLGRHSGSEFLPNLKISQVHGKLRKTEDERWILPLYHPAAALYNGGLRETLLTDFQLIPKALTYIDQQN